MTKDEQKRYDDNKKKFKERLLELGCHASIAKRVAKYVEQYPASRYDNYGFVSAAINGTFDWDKTKEGRNFWQLTHDFYYTLETQIMMENDEKVRLASTNKKKKP